MSEEFSSYTGYIGICKPGEDNIEFKEFDFNTSLEGMNDAFVRIIDLVTGNENPEIPGKIANAGFLPSPFNEFTMFMNQDQFADGLEYNVGFFGTPIFGNMAFLQVDLNSEDGKIIPISEEKKIILSEAMAHFKKFEKETGIYDAMCKTDKNKFLEEFVNEQNNILEESTKDIKGDNFEELQAAKQELENTVKKEDE